MTPKNIHDIRNTWEKLRHDPDGLTTRFYAELFRIAPEVRPLFSGLDMQAQGRKLAAAIGLVVRHADNLAPIVAPLRDMGARHAGYGVTDAHYDAVAQALITTLENRLGDAFTPDARKAWAAAYTAIAGTMQAGAKDLMKQTA